MLHGLNPDPSVDRMLPGSWAPILLLLTSTSCWASPNGERGMQDGDVLLAAFFPIHERILSVAAEPSFYHPEYHPSQNVCGPLKAEDSIQFLEAFYFALDHVNADPHLLPGIKVGAIALDSCSDENHALEQAVELLRYLILQGTDQSPFQCQDGSFPIIPPKYEAYQKIIGVVGAARSAVTMHLAALFQLFHVPQVSYLSTSSELSQKDKFPYFARTVPSDTNQAKAIVRLLKTFQWSYISVVYDDSFYGTRGFYDLTKAAEEENICFAYSASLDYDTLGWGDKDYMKIAWDLYSSSANVVVVFAQRATTRRLFEAIHKQHSSRRLIFIGSDGWSGRNSVTYGLERVLNNTIAIQPLIYTLPSFDTHFRNQKPIQNNRNPWFKEFWEHHFDCRFQPLTPSEPSNNESYRTNEKICTGKEVISPESGYTQQLNLHFVYDAVYAYAHAFDSLLKNICGPNYYGLCSAAQPQNLTGEQIMAYLRQVKFTGVTGRPFYFVNQTDGPPNYTVMYFGLNPGTRKYEWRSIGTYMGEKPDTEELVLDAEFLNQMPRYPSSQCSQPCLSDQAKKYISDDRCCFVCNNCSEWQVILPMSDGNEICVTCPKGHEPNTELSECISIEAQYITYDNPWALTVLLFASIGILFTLTVLGIFLYYFNTPVIKAMGRELSLLLLAGVMTSLGTVFLVVAPPTVVMCAVTRFLLGVSYTIIYASILTKTNRISRIFSDTSTPNKARFTSPGSQLLIASFLIFGECVILAIWLGAVQPAVIPTYPSPAEKVLVCFGMLGTGTLVPLIYPFLLLLLCAIYAFKTRKTPEGFNETRLIAFTSYTTFIIWLAFTPLQCIIEDFAMRAFVQSIALCLTSYVCLACIFVPKIYVCLCRPQKNTREAVMARTSSVNSASLFVEPAASSTGAITPGEACHRHPIHSYHGGAGFPQPGFFNSALTLGSPSPTLKRRISTRSLPDADELQQISRSVTSLKEVALKMQSNTSNNNNKANGPLRPKAAVSLRRAVTDPKCKRTYRESDV